MNERDKLIYEKIARKDLKFWCIILSDVLNYIENLINEEWLVYDFRTITEILSEWNNKYPTYEEQSESCKEFIYNLIK